MSRLRLRLTAVLVLLTFVTCDAGFAQTLGGASPSAASRISVLDLAKNPSLIDIPYDFATLKEIHRGKGDRLIVHIQDAHLNLSGQQSLAGALDYMMGQYDIPLVLVEGADRDVSLNEVRKSLPLETWKIAAKRFLYDGMISGEEYLNLTTEHPMKIIGVEYRYLYDENLKAYAELSETREEILGYLYTVQKSLDRVKNKVYPEILRKFEENTDPARQNDFKSNLDGIFTLADEARIELSKNYPETQKLRILRRDEKKIDFGQANAEQADLFQKLSELGVSRNLQRHLEESKRIKNKQISQDALIQNIFRIARKHHVNLNVFPALLAYESYLKQFSNLRMDLLLDELQKLEDKAYWELLPDEDAKRIRAIDRYVGLLKKAYSIQMSSTEFKLFLANEEDFPTQSWQAYLNKKLTELGYYRDLVPYKPLLEEARQTLERFYYLVDRRDFAFIENMKTIMKTEDEDGAFLIAGGYHTDHLTELLRDEDASYVVLTPIVTYETDIEKYEDILLQPLKKSWDKRQASKNKTAANEISRTKTTADTLRMLAGLMKPKAWWDAYRQSLDQGWAGTAAAMMASKSEDDRHLSDLINQAILTTGQNAPGLPAWEDETGGTRPNRTAGPIDADGVAGQIAAVRVSIRDRDLTAPGISDAEYDRSNILYRRMREASESIVGAKRDELVQAFNESLGTNRLVWERLSDYEGQLPAHLETGLFEFYDLNENLERRRFRILYKHDLRMKTDTYYISGAAGNFYRVENDKLPLLDAIDTRFAVKERSTFKGHLYSGLSHTQLYRLSRQERGQGLLSYLESRPADGGVAPAMSEDVIVLIDEKPRALYDGAWDYHIAFPLGREVGIEDIAHEATHDLVSKWLPFKSPYRLALRWGDGDVNDAIDSIDNVSEPSVSEGRDFWNRVKAHFSQNHSELLFRILHLAAYSHVADAFVSGNDDSLVEEAFAGLVGTVLAGEKGIDIYGSVYRITAADVIFLRDLGIPIPVDAESEYPVDIDEANTVDLETIRHNTQRMLFMRRTDDVNSSKQETPAPIQEEQEERPLSHVREDFTFGDFHSTDIPDPVLDLGVSPLQSDNSLRILAQDFANSEFDPSGDLDNLLESIHNSSSDPLLYDLSAFESRLRGSRASGLPQGLLTYLAGGRLPRGSYYLASSGSDNSHIHFEISSSRDLIIGGRMLNLRPGTLSNVRGPENSVTGMRTTMSPRLAVSSLSDAVSGFTDTRAFAHLKRIYENIRSKTWSLYQKSDVLDASASFALAIDVGDLMAIHKDMVNGSGLIDQALGRLKDVASFYRNKIVTSKSGETRQLAYVIFVNVPSGLSGFVDDRVPADVPTFKVFDIENIDNLVPGEFGVLPWEAAPEGPSHIPIRAIFEMARSVAASLKSIESGDLSALEVVRALANWIMGHKIFGPEEYSLLARYQIGARAKYRELTIKGIGLQTVDMLLRFYQRLRASTIWAA